MPRATVRRPLRPQVRVTVSALLAVSPDGRTLPELQLFLIAARPASRSTIQRALDELQAEGMVTTSPEPFWRRLARVRLLKTGRSSRSKAAQGPTFRLYRATPSLRAHVADHLRTPHPTPE